MIFIGEETFSVTSLTGAQWAISVMLSVLCIAFGFVMRLILWWGSMVTPIETPAFGAIVLPVPIPLLYLGSLSTILRN